MPPLGDRNYEVILSFCERVRDDPMKAYTAHGFALPAPSACGVVRVAIAAGQYAQHAGFMILNCLVWVCVTKSSYTNPHPILTKFFLLQHVA